MNLGTIGVWTSYRPFGIDRAADAAKRAEQLGYTTFWLGGSPKVADVRPILEATSTLVAATGILNVWSNEPGEAAADDAALRAEFPGRFQLRSRQLSQCRLVLSVEPQGSPDLRLRPQSVAAARPWTRPIRRV